MLFHGDCLEQLKNIESDSIDSLITDPPAGISFMNKKWDDDKGGRDQWIQWMTQVMQECMRVMKPGAHGLVWAIPRTSHWTATALENAGFEVRDVITHLFGSGFPKSLNISKAIDKAAGAERAIVTEINKTQSFGRETATGFGGDIDRGGVMHVTAPEQAKQWDGWGTALKPASEHWILIRKPLSEKTVASNVIKHGCGGINIDGSRIVVSVNDPNHRIIENKTTLGTTFGSREEIKSVDTGKSQLGSLGRFPANLVLSHSEYCTDEQCELDCAVKALDAQSGDLHLRGNKQVTTTGGGLYGHATFKGVGLSESGYAGASRFFYCAKISTKERNQGLDGTDLIWETDVWEKQDLNSKTENIRQLSKDISEEALTAFRQWSIDTFGKNTTDQSPTNFKFTISMLSKLIIELRTLNASHHLHIKESIQDAIKTIEANGLSLVESVGFINKLKQDFTKDQTDSWVNVVHVLLHELAEIRKFAKSGNFHSTVKPKKLMSYLIKLITPPNGTVLDPFMGSGSTGIAASENGFNFIGIEKELEYFEIASKRIKGCL